jgi:hypothetical protein
MYSTSSLLLIVFELCAPLSPLSSKRSRYTRAACNSHRCSVALSLIIHDRRLNSLLLLYAGIALSTTQNGCARLKACLVNVRFSQPVKAVLLLYFRLSFINNWLFGVFQDFCDTPLYIGCVLLLYLPSLASKNVPSSIPDRRLGTRSLGRYFRNNLRHTISVYLSSSSTQLLHSRGLQRPQYGPKVIKVFSFVSQILTSHRQLYIGCTLLCLFSA